MRVLANFTTFHTCAAAIYLLHGVVILYDRQREAMKPYRDAIDRIAFQAAACNLALAMLTNVVHQITVSVPRGARLLSALHSYMQFQIVCWGTWVLSEQWYAIWTNESYVLRGVHAAVHLPVLRLAWRARRIEPAVLRATPV